MTENVDPSYLPPDLASHYDSGYESVRLSQRRGQIELARTRIILGRRLPPPPARILDIGGGPGVHAAWLAKKGYDVHLIDVLPLHVRLARETSEAQPDHPFSVEMGDARSLPVADESADAALLLGPLYHLTEREDRLRALREAGRAVRPGGFVFAAAISRFASLFDGFRYGFHDDPAFVEIVERDLREGQHRNPTGNPAYFTTAFFHRPDDLEAEVRDASLLLEAVLPVESVGWLLPDFDDWWDNPTRRETLLHLLELIEREPALVGATAHLLAIARVSG